jgi:hypothetical protein
MANRSSWLPSASVTFWELRAVATTWWPGIQGGPGDVDTHAPAGSGDQHDFRG